MDKTITITLHDAREVRPRKSGAYLAHTVRGNMWGELMYSKRHGAFNALDYQDAPHVLEVDYWAELPDLTDDEGSDDE